MMDRDNFLSGFLADRLSKWTMGVAVVGALLSAISFFQDSHHFYYAYLISFVFFLTISLGCLFFILIQHLVRSGWSVVVRRVPEVAMKNIWVIALLFIPIIFGIHDLYHWSHADAVAHDHILSVKAPYLNTPFFIIRAILFFGIWIWLARKFFNGSVAQDSSGDKSITLGLQKASTYGILLFALSVTFASVDWVMSVTPHWYSTMFGVQFFAGCAVASLAFIVLVYLALHRAGYLKNVLSVDHIHDLGKLMYGFNIFWAYVTFSQYFLIWYANIPEETVWYTHHFFGNWNTVAVVITIGHFAVPFLLFMSRHVKRNYKAAAAMMIWMLCIHLVEIFWVITPTVYPEGVHVGLANLGTFLFVGGIFLTAFIRQLKQVPLYPLKDPRLEDSLHMGH